MDDLAIARSSMNLSFGPLYFLPVKSNWCQYQHSLSTKNIFYNTLRNAWNIEIYLVHYVYDYIKLYMKTLLFSIIYKDMHWFDGLLHQYRVYKMGWGEILQGTWGEIS